jgi:hypothetical protein
VIRPSVASISALLALTAAIYAAPQPASAQTRADPLSSPPSSSSPSAVAGPDFSGVWMAFAVETPGADDNSPSYSTAGEAALDAFVAQFHEIPEVGAHCVGTGMPGVMLSTVSYPIEIVQTEPKILMVAELETQVRRIYLDGRGHPDGAFPSMVGDSIGRWEGDTLLIDTSLLEPWELRPWPRGDAAHIAERVYLTTLDEIDARPSGFVGELDAAISDEVLVFDITLTDPAYYDGPQRRIAYYQRVADTTIAEYACINGLWRDELEAQRIR